MGLFDIFKRSKSKPQTAAFNGEDATVDFTENGVYINGNRIEIPMHIDALTKIFGKARTTSHKPDADDKAFMNMVYHEQVTKRVNYTWDDLGIIAYTRTGKIVSAFSVQFTKEDYPQSPKNVFKGKVTINGKPWFPEIMNGEDCEVMRQYHFDMYMICAEYTDFEEDDSARTEDSFTSLELDLKMTDYRGDDGDGGGG